MRILALPLLLVLMFPQLALATPTLTRGTYQGAAWACVVVDPLSDAIDIVTAGRRDNTWSAEFMALEQVPADCTAVINGTFFSFKYNQPAGILVYDNGRAAWNPTFERPYDGRPRRVITLPRWYLAVFQDGRLAMGDGAGRTVAEVRRALGPLRCLLGGLGLLVSDGRRAISPATLAHEGFDALSGLRPADPVPRSAVGITADGRLLMVIADRLSLDAMADLMLARGARQALFLDCGGSTQMRAGNWRYAAGRPLPTWLVARPLKASR